MPTSYAICYNSNLSMFRQEVKKYFKINSSILDKLVYLKSTLVSKDDEVYIKKTCDIVIETHIHILFNVRAYKDIIDTIGGACYISMDNTTQNSLIFIHLETNNRNKLLKKASEIIDLLNNDTNINNIEVSLDLVTNDRESMIFETRPAMLAKELIEFGGQKNISGSIYIDVTNDVENCYLPTFMLTALLIKNTSEYNNKIVTFKFLNRSKDVYTTVENVRQSLSEGGLIITQSELYSIIDEDFIASQENNTR